MRKQSFIWTAIPAGRGPGNTLRLSVFVTPKLETDDPSPTLGLFPDLLTWPERDLRFRVAFRDGPTLPAIIVPRSPKVQPWSYIFKSTTPVDAPEDEPIDNLPVRSYPTRHVYNFVKDAYITTSAISQGKRPTAAQLATLTPLGQVALDRPGLGPKVAALGGLPVLSTGALKLVDRERVNRVRLQQSTLLKAQRFIPYLEQADPTSDFIQFQDFVRAQEAPHLRPKVPELGFHDLVSTLAEYPQIMRDIHLIFDVTVDLGDQRVPAESTVKVLTSWRSVTATISLSPETAYRLDSSTFAARSNDPELVNGMLDLSDTLRVSVVDVDLEAAALKVMQVANDLSRALEEDGGEREMAMPALSTAGLSITRAGLAEGLVKRLKRSDELRAVWRDYSRGLAPVMPVLFMEDLVRGYRVDVWDSQSQKWHSLCGRVGTYTVDGVTEPLVYIDEGWVSQGLTQEVTGGDLRATESRTVWNGWSLAVPRPGRSVGLDGAPDSGEGGAPRNYGLTVSFTVPPRTLPRQRYGVSYRFRARAVDLAGNSLPFDATSNDFSRATEPKPHWRFEPVMPPMLVPRTPLTRGETVERMVLHSQHGQPSTETSERHVAPPRIPQVMAEKHGQFDGTNGLGAERYNYITAFDKPFEYEGTDGTGVIKRYPENQLPLTYLADFTATGVTFRNLPGTGTIVGAYTRASFVPPAGPGPRPFRIKLQDGTAYPQWNESDGELVVSLPKGEMRTVAITCRPTPASLEQLGPWHWRIADEPTANVANLRNLALEGSLFQVTPPRYVELVHAVPKPLQPPGITTLTAERQKDRTDAWLKGAMTLCGKSTGQVDLLAEWEDLLDLPGHDSYRMVQGKAHVKEYTGIDRAATNMQFTARQEFGDTRYRRVKYKPVGTTRFREYFVDDKNPPIPMPDMTARPDVWFEVDVPSAARPAPPNVAYVVPIFRRTPHQDAFGTGYRRKGGLRIYLERPWHSSGAGERLGVVVMHHNTTDPWDIERLRPYVTQWGRDPIWQTNGILMSPQQNMFLETTEKPVGMKLLETYPRVALAAYPVTYDPQRKLWFADVVFYDGDQYSTFVRLALVRYQPHSVADVEVSPVVLADFAQLTADRTATVSSVSGQPTKLNLRVVGMANSNELAGNRGNPLVITVERPAPSATPQPATAMQWLPVPGNAQLVYPTVGTPVSSSIWTAQVTLPEPRGSRPFRLVIREYERILGDSAAAWTTEWFLNQGRLVYAETIEV